MSDFWQRFYKEQVFPALDIGAVLVPLRPRESGNKYYIVCPECGQKTAFCYKNTGAMACNRENHCGWKADLLEYVNRGPVRGDDMKRAVETLARIAGVQVPEMTPEVKAAFTEAEKKQAAWQRIIDYTNNAMTPEAHDYLRGRGFDDPAKFEIGYFRNVEDLRHEDTALLHDLGFAYRNDAGALKLFSGWRDRVGGPIRDKRGRVVGFWGRALHGTDAKYLRTATFVANDIGGYGIHATNEKAIFVEGEFDALTLRICEQPGVALWGNPSCLTMERWGTLFSSGIRTAVLWSDADKAGQRFIVQAIDAARAGKPASPSIYIVESNNGFPGKDPNEIYMAHGENAIRECVRNPTRAVAYRASAYAIGIDFSDNIQADIYRETCTKFARSVVAADEKIELQFFLDRVASISGLDRTSLDAHYKQLITNNEQQLLANEIISAAQNHEFDTVNKLLVNRRDMFSRVPVRPLRASIHELSSTRQWLEQFRGKDLIGVPQYTLAKLDETLSGLRGITVLAGGTNVSKTGLALQLTTDVLRNNPDVCSLIISLEMDLEDVQSRIIARLGGAAWDEMARQDEVAWKRGEMAFREFGDRLFIIDENICPEITEDYLIAAAERLMEETGCSKIFIVIDYLDLWPIPADVKREYRSVPEQEKWQMKQMQNIRRRLLGAPMLVISEVRKGAGEEYLTPDDVMGTSRKSYTADNVIIFNVLHRIDLARRFEVQGGVGLMTFNEKRLLDLTVKRVRAEAIEGGEAVKLYLNSMGIELGFLDVVKARRAGKKRKIEVTNFFRHSNIIEGYHVEQPEYQVTVNSVEF